MSVPYDMSMLLSITGSNFSPRAGLTMQVIVVSNLDLQYSL